MICFSSLPGVKNNANDSRLHSRVGVSGGQKSEMEFSVGGLGREGGGRCCRRVRSAVAT